MLVQSMTGTKHVCDKVSTDSFRAIRVSMDPKFMKLHGFSKLNMYILPELSPIAIRFPDAA